MAQLDVTSSTFFGPFPLNDITNINFVTAGVATATFASSQFDNVAIRNNVTITGSGFVDRIVTNGGGLDASAWEFSGWTQGSDTIRFNGSGLSDTFVASRQAETIDAGGGADLIVSGHSLQGDTFNGGLGNDTFRYLGFTTPVNDTIDGGAGRNDKLEIAATGTCDFTLAAINRVEQLAFASGGSTIGQFLSSAFGGSGISRVNGSANGDALTIFSGTFFDLAAAVTFTNWTDGTDNIVIVGTADADTISGSFQNDVIESGGGNDTLAGRGGDDDFIVQSSAVASISGGGGFDTVRVFSSDIFVKSLQATSLSSVEALAFDARGTEANVSISLGGQQIGSGAGQIEQVFGSVRTDGLIVFTSDVNGFAADLSGVTFSGWTAGVDAMVISTSAGADDTVKAADVATNVNMSTGVDSVRGGSADDTFNTGVALSAGFSLDGKGGFDTLRITSSFSGTMSLESGVVSDIEFLDNESASALIYIHGSQIGGAGTISTVDGGGDSASTVLFVTGTQANLGSVDLLDWGFNDAINFLGTAGADTLTGSSQGEVFNGTQGADRLAGRGGTDTVSYKGSHAGVAVSLAAGTAASGFARGDTLIGIENVTGSGFADVLLGDDQANALTGEAGNDVLNGRQGADTLTGNDGDDRFVFSNLAGSPAGGERDRILDFSQSAGNRDVIDLSAIDAAAGTATNDSFSLVSAFSAEGQIIAVQDGFDTVLQINTTGADGAEMEIVLVGITATSITTADFIL